MDQEILLARLSALTDKSRFTMLQLMAGGAIGTCCDRIEAYEHGCCVADVVSQTGLSQPTVSHHLKVLEKADLVHRDIRGPWTCYFLNRDAVQEVLQELRITLCDVADESKGECCP